MADRRLDLLSCPFCGGEPTVIKNKGRSRILTSYWRGQVRCKKCNVHTPILKSPDAAEAAWNKRAGA